MKDNGTVTQQEYALSEGVTIVSRTDKFGNILSANEAFIEASGFDWKDLVGQPNQCALGKWLAGDGQKYQSIPEMQELITTHTEMHAIVGKKFDALELHDRATAMIHKNRVAQRSTQIISLLDLTKLQVKKNTRPENAKPAPLMHDEKEF